MSSSSSSTSSGWSYESLEGSVSSESSQESVDLAEVDVEGQRQELSRIQQEQQDHRLAEQLQNAPSPSSSTSSNTSDFNAFFGDWHPPEQHDAPRAIRNSRRAQNEQQHPVECTICMDPPKMQRFCNFCEQSVGCKSCIATWQSSNPSCPLCRHEWKNQPQVHGKAAHERRQRTSSGF